MKQQVLIYHDEIIFNTNDSQLWMWAAEGMVVLRPKTRGSGIMVSDFIDQHSGFLQLSEVEQAHAKSGAQLFGRSTSLAGIWCRT